ncbi:DUF2345 domain-containing protein, partial [Neisseria sp. P0008.S010]|uniref:DUF2345 domain-containing protein n=1 Tax=Neisseria sp. P0008.S010 TaxID=3436707 RepID=UPI003F7EF3D4
SHTDISAGQSLTAHAAEGLNLFAQSQGIKVQANQGAVTVQAQNDELQLNALKDATLTSSAGKIAIAAKEEILITCKGAYIKLANGEVEIGSPKVVRVRAPLVVGGPSSLSQMFNEMPKTQFDQEVIVTTPGGKPIANRKFILTRADGTKIRGVTDSNGSTGIQKNDAAMEKFTLTLLPKDEKK